MKRITAMAFNTSCPCEEKEKADGILEQVDKICKQLNIDFWLVQGTCLGFYRDNGYIKNDYDIDISVSRKDHKRLVTRLRAHNFRLIYYRNKNSILFKDGILLDIFKFKPKKSSVLKHNNRYYLIPKPEPYLTKTFGNWQTKVTGKRKNAVVVIGNHKRGILWNMKQKIIDGQTYHFKFIKNY